MRCPGSQSGVGRVSGLKWAPPLCNSCALHNLVSEFSCFFFVGERPGLTQQVTVTKRNRWKAGGGFCQKSLKWNDPAVRVIDFPWTAGQSGAKCVHCMKAEDEYHPKSSAMIYDANYFCLLFFCFGSSVFLSFTHIQLCLLCQAFSMTVTAFQRAFINYPPPLRLPHPSLQGSLFRTIRNPQGWSSPVFFYHVRPGAEPFLRRRRRRFLHALARAFIRRLRQPPRPRESKSKKSQALHFRGPSSAGRWLLLLGSQRHLEILACNAVSCAAARAVASGKQYPESKSLI